MPHPSQTDPVGQDLVTRPGQVVLTNPLSLWETGLNWDSHKAASHFLLTSPHNGRGLFLP